MDPRIGRAAAFGLAGLTLALALTRAWAQEAEKPGPPPVASPALVPPPSAPAAASAATAATPEPGVPPPPAAAAASPEDANTEADTTEDKPAAAPVAPIVPARAPAAILRVLDKVTAETMAFEAPIGKRVRYKSLVFEVKACATRGQTDPQPRSSAYVVVTSDSSAVGPLLGSRQVFKGWMFANAPAVHALTHPVYDAWLAACSAIAPGT